MNFQLFNVQEFLTLCSSPPETLAYQEKCRERSAVYISALAEAAEASDDECAVLLAAQAALTDHDRRTIQ